LKATGYRRIICLQWGIVSTETRESNFSPKREQARRIRAFAKATRWVSPADAAPLA
jgi:hypothetical protein